VHISASRTAAALAINQRTALRHPPRADQARSKRIVCLRLALSREKNGTRRDIVTRDIISARPLTQHAQRRA